ncbi:MAG: hypothetical protein ACFHVJ_08630 [Aestuariibacter sp.]
MKIDHINISAPRTVLDEEKKFFCEIMGLKEGFRPAFSSNGYWLYNDEQAIIHLVESERHFASDKQGYFDHVAFQMEGAERFISKLIRSNVAHQVKFVPKTTTTQVFVRTPAGIRLEANFKNEEVNTE